MNTAKKRLEYIDALRGFAILCVVAGHSTGLWDNVHKMISAFLLPVFFVISGFLFQYKNEAKLPFKTFLKKRFTGIMIPYFGFSIIALLYEICAGGISNSVDWLVILRGVVQTVTFFGKSTLWFLPALFFSELIFFVICKYLKKTVWIVVIPLATGIFASVTPYFMGTGVFIMLWEAREGVPAPLLGFYILHMILRVLYLLPFLSCGYIFSLLMKNKTGFKKWWVKAIEITVSVVILAATYAAMQLNENVVDVRNLIAQYMPLALLFGMLSSCALLMIFMDMPKIPLIHEFLTLCGVYSLIIMATHLDYGIMTNAISYAAFRNQTVDHLKNYVFLFHIFIIEAAFEIPIIYAINKFFPFLAGKGFAPYKQKKFKLVKDGDSE